jgi:hypothetical protein
VEKEGRGRESEKVLSGAGGSDEDVREGRRRTKTTWRVGSAWVHSLSLYLSLSIYIY